MTGISDGISTLRDNAGDNVMDEANDAVRVNVVAGTVTTNSSPTTTGGATTSHLVSAATINATVVKASAGQAYGIQAFNINALPCYVKFFNKATAPAPSSDGALIIKTVLVPGNTAGGGVVVQWPYGVPFSTGIGFVIVTGIAVTNETAVAASEVVVNVDYK